MKFLGPIPPTNYRTGRMTVPNRIVIHWMAGSIESADARFKNPASQVSAHYGISREGEVFCWVDPVDVAFHAGDWSVNLESVGIEHECGPDDPPTEALYRASVGLLRELSTGFDIPLDRDTVIPHRQVVATQCPGTLDLERLIREANGGDMAFKDDPDAQAFVQDVRNFIDAAKTRLAIDAHHRHVQQGPMTSEPFPPDPPVPGAEYAGASSDLSIILWQFPDGRIHTLQNGVDLTP